MQPTVRGKSVDIARLDVVILKCWYVSVPSRSRLRHRICNLNLNNGHTRLPAKFISITFTPLYPKRGQMLKAITTVSTLLLFLFLHTVLAVAAEQKILEKITFDIISGGEEQITFTLNGLYVPKIFAMKGEKPRVVFDFQDTKPSRLLQNTINTNGKFIKRIRVGIHNEPTPKTRVVFDLMPDQDVDFKHSFDRKNNALIISVFQAGSEPEQPPAPQKEVLKKEPQATTPAQSKTPEKPTPAVAPETTEPITAVQLPAVIEKQNAEITQTTPTAADVPAATVAPQVETPTEPAPPVATGSAEPPAEPRTVTPQVEIKTFSKAEIPTDTQTENNKSAAKPQTAEQKKAETVHKPARKADAPILNSVTFDNSSNRGEMVLFRLNKFHPPIVFGVDEGQPRVVCDFKETAAAEDLPAVIATKGKFVRSIRIGKETNPEKVRVVLDLAATKKYDLQQVFFKEDNLFVLIINTLGSTPSTDDLKQLPGEQQD